MSKSIITFKVQRLGKEEYRVSINMTKTQVFYNRNSSYRDSYYPLYSINWKNFILKTKQNPEIFLEVLLWISNNISFITRGKTHLFNVL